MNINEYPLKAFKILKNSRKYMKINQNHWKVMKKNSEIKIRFKHDVNVISYDFCVWYRKEEKIFRHSWKSPPRIFEKHQSQNWSSYYVSNLKFMKPLINRENAFFLFLTTNHFFSSSRRVQGIWIRFIASTPS